MKWRCELPSVTAPFGARRGSADRDATGAGPAGREVARFGVHHGADAGARAVGGLEEADRWRRAGRVLLLLRAAPRGGGNRVGQVRLTGTDRGVQVGGHVAGAVGGVVLAHGVGDERIAHVLDGVGTTHDDLHDGPGGVRGRSQRRHPGAQRAERRRCGQPSTKEGSLHCGNVLSQSDTGDRDFGPRPCSPRSGSVLSPGGERVTGATQTGDEEHGAAQQTLRVTTQPWPGCGRARPARPASRDGCRRPLPGRAQGLFRSHADACGPAGAGAPPPGPG